MFLQLAKIEDWDSFHSCEKFYVFYPYFTAFHPEKKTDFLTPVEDTSDSNIDCKNLLILNVEDRHCKVMDVVMKGRENVKE